MCTFVVRLPVRMSARLRVRLHTRMYVRLCARMYICMYISMYVSVYLFENPSVRWLYEPDLDTRYSNNICVMESLVPRRRVHAVSIVRQQ